MTCFAVLSDGQYVVCESSDRTILLWDGSSGDSKHIASISGIVVSLALSGNGRELLLGCMEGSVVVRCFLSMNEIVCDIGLCELSQLDRYGYCLPAVAVNGDGRFVASGTKDRTVRRWDGVAGAAIGTSMRSCEERIWSVFANKAGSRIVSGADDGVFVWDAAR